MPGSIQAQQSQTSTQKLSERLLDAVRGNDVEAIRSILALASGRALVTLPIGLTAAGRAVDRGYYEVAHQILAVRTQQIQLEKELGAGQPRGPGSPASLLKQTTPPARPGSQIPGPPGATAPTPATKQPPKAAARTATPTSEPPPSLPGPNPFDSSYTPGAELPQIVPVDQPDSRSDRPDTLPVALMAPPPEPPLRGPSENTEADHAPTRISPTPINALPDAPGAKKIGVFGQLLDTISNTLNPFHS